MSRCRNLEAPLHEPRKRIDPTSPDNAQAYKEARAADIAPTRGVKVVPLFEAKAFSMLELMHRTFAPMHWAVETYVPEGTILIAGKPKSGKSWFVLQPDAVRRSSVSAS